MKQVVFTKLKNQAYNGFVSVIQNNTDHINADNPGLVCDYMPQIDEASASQSQDLCIFINLIQVPWQIELKKVGISVELGFLLVCQFCEQKCLLPTPAYAVQHMYRVHRVPKAQIVIPEPWNTPEEYLTPTNTPITPVPGT